MGEPIRLRPSRKREPPTGEDVVLPGESQYAKRGAQEITKEMRLPLIGSLRLLLSMLNLHAYRYTVLFLLIPQHAFFRKQTIRRYLPVPYHYFLLLLIYL